MTTLTAFNTWCPPSIVFRDHVLFVDEMLSELLDIIGLWEPPGHPADDHLMKTMTTLTLMTTMMMLMTTMVMLMTTMVMLMTTMMMMMTTSSLDTSTSATPRAEWEGAMVSRQPRNSEEQQPKDSIRFQIEGFKVIVKGF